VTHLPENPATFGRPYPAYTNITMTTSTGKSAYDGLQFGFNGRTRHVTLGGTYVLSRTYDNHNGNRGGTPTNWFNLNDEYTYASSDQRHRFTANAVASLPYSIQASAIYFLGSPRTIGVGTSLDPFNLGYSGRWLEAPSQCPCVGTTVPRNSQRTIGYDRKLDLRLSKSLKVQQRATLQGVVDVFNVLNTRNLTGYGTNVFSKTYLQPSSSTNLFY